MNWKDMEGNMCNLCLGKLSEITKDLSEISQCHEKGSGSRFLKYKIP
jgi:hypothetical protein